MIDWMSVLQVAGGLALVWVLGARLEVGSARHRRIVPHPQTRMGAPPPNASHVPEVRR